MKKIVVLTGAGISKESGIDTFRDADGLWFNYKIEEVAHIDGWRKDKSKVLSFYNKRRAQLEEVHPNAAHISLAELEKEYDVQIITQNVDDLHERAGSTKVLHLHGELNKACSSRNKMLTVPYPSTGINIGDKHEDGSQLRPYIVWFGENVPNIQIATDIVGEADILVVIGTSMNVYPAAGLAYLTKEGTPIYCINPDDVEMEGVDHIKMPATTGVAEFIKRIK